MAVVAAAAAAAVAADVPGMLPAGVLLREAHAARQHFNERNAHFARVKRERETELARGDNAD